ncbi:hypothetical protein ACFXHA_45070 [Nocardia sp. NPDC059240]
MIRPRIHPDDLGLVGDLLALLLLAVVMWQVGAWLTSWASL